MLSLRNITKSYNDKTILDKINLSVNRGDVVALIGENGAGKTTLLKILLGEVAPDEGEVLLHNEIVGYVPQEPECVDGIVNYSFDNQEQWRIDYALGLVMLEGSGDKKVKNLSGGQKTRLALAQVLAKNPEPTILLLDEPTNNIDQEGLDWLQHFVKSFSGAILLVSHDRSFINEVATSVVELRKGVFRQYGGNYDFYKKQKEVDYQARLKEYEKSVDKRRQLERVFREKQERAKKGLKNQKMSDNDKSQFNWHQDSVQKSFSGQARAMRSRIDQLEVVERPEFIKSYSMGLSTNKVCDKKLMTVLNLKKVIEGRTVLKDVSFEIRSGERWHIKGLNGAGKSTLLKIIAGQLNYDDGEVKNVNDINIGYFSQDAQGLGDNCTAFKILEETGAQPADIYQQAVSMGLTEKDLRQKPSQLSRGQQAKLVFIKLLLGGRDILILDEPTNHLDIATKERLENSLKNYKGTLIIASHDKYFIQEVGITNELLLKKRV